MEIKMRTYGIRSGEESIQKSNSSNKKILNSLSIYKIFTFFIVSMPIINCYVSTIPSIGAGELVLLVIVLYILLCMLQKNKKIVLHNYYLFVFYGIFISLLSILTHNYISYLAVSKRLIRDVFYFLLIFFFSINFFNKEFALKCYKIIAVIVSSYLIIQCISFYLFNYVLPWKIPGIDFNIAWSTTEYLQHYKSIYKYYFRPTSLFTEPAQFAQYVAPYLLISLFYPFENNEKNNYKLSIFLSFALLLSTSASGYAFVLIIWSMWFIYITYKKRKINNIIKFLLVIIFSLIIFIILYLNNNAFAIVVNRFTDIGGGTANSGNVRLLGGFYYYAKLDPLYKMFGIGFGSIKDFSDYYSITTPFATQTEYMNSFSYILVSTGLFGLFIYFLIFVSIFKQGNSTCKALIILFLFMLISSSIYSQPLYVVMLSFMLSFQKLKIIN